MPTNFLRLNLTLYFPQPDAFTISRPGWVDLCYALHRTFLKYEITATGFTTHQKSIVSLILFVRSINKFARAVRLLFAVVYWQILLSLCSQWSTIGYLNQQIESSLKSCFVTNQRDSQRVAYPVPTPFVISCGQQWSLKNCPNQQQLFLCRS